LLAGAIGAALAVVAISFAAFGGDALDALALIGENQERTSQWSLPQRAADGIAAVTDASAQSAVDYTRALFAVGFALALALLLRRAWRERERPIAWIEALGWATFALLVASAWLVPWYAIWLMPFAALAQSRALLAASLALCAYMLVIAVPL